MMYLTEVNTSFPRMMGIIEKLNLYAEYNCAPPEEIKQKYNIKWDSKSIKYLGVLITKNLSLLYVANYKLINQNIRKDKERWSTYQIDFSSKINVVKMNILPRLVSISVNSGTIKTINLPEGRSRECW